MPAACRVVSEIRVTKVQPPIPAEQARIVQLLVARITVSEAGLAIDLRHDGLGAIAALMALQKKEVA
jgi:site-specific DNA recombinase